MLQFRCEGCKHERNESESEHTLKGFCSSCNAKGVGLCQVRKVEKWEARDGTFHDSLQAAERHQLMKDLRDALSACEGRPEDQARHLLLHFDIVRRSEKPKPPTVEYHKAPKTVCTTCYFVSGALIVALLTQLLVWFR